LEDQNTKLSAEIQDLRKEKDSLAKQYEGLQISKRALFIITQFTHSFVYIIHLNQPKVYG